MELPKDSVGTIEAACEPRAWRKNKNQKSHNSKTSFLPPEGFPFYLFTGRLFLAPSKARYLSCHSDLFLLTSAAFNVGR